MTFTLTGVRIFIIENNRIQKGSAFLVAEQPLVSISNLAQELLITTRTIRYYEEMGLLTPLHHEKMSQRLYGPRERARLTLILRGKRLGFSLAEIKEMLDLYDIDRTEGLQLERTVAYGEKRLRELEEKIQELILLKEELLDYHQQFTELLRKRNEEHQSKEGDPSNDS